MSLMLLAFIIGNSDVSLVLRQCPASATSYLKLAKLLEPLFIVLIILVETPVKATLMESHFKIKDSN